MSRLLFAFSLVLGAAACQERALGIDDVHSDGGGVDLRGRDLSGFDLPAVVDLASPVTDLSTFHPGDLSGLGGVQCGMQTCAPDATCCLGVGGGGLSAMCSMSGSCGDAGIPATCDGPEDCPGATPDCCVGVALGGGGQPMGAAMCTATCPAAVMIGGGGGMGGGGKIATKLCHSAVDCTGYTGTAPILGMTAFNACCGLPGISFQVCAPGLLASLGAGIDCN